MTDETRPTPEAVMPGAEVAASEPTAAAAEPALLAEVTQPVSYEAFKMPEGASIDPDELARATELFRASSLDQAQAQKFIDLAVSREQAAARKGQQAFAELQQKWVSEIKADPDIGGQRLQASLASAGRAIDRLGVPGLREALNLTGAGNHPAVVKAFVRLGQMVAEDRFQPGKDAAPAASRSLAEVIYDGTPRA